MKCPICTHDQVPTGAANCPNCESDLSAFTAIQQATKQRKGLRTARSVLFILVVGMAFGLAWTAYELQAGTATTEQPDPNPEITAETYALKEQLANQQVVIDSLEGEVNALLATIVSSTEDLIIEDEQGERIEHIVREGETLWSISELYHGHGFEHLGIAGHNDINDPHMIHVGDTVIVTH